jgi:hypothetical protein
MYCLLLIDSHEVDIFFTHVCMCAVYDTSTVLILSVGHDVSVSVRVRVYYDIVHACVYVCAHVHQHNYQKSCD